MSVGFNGSGDYLRRTASLPTSTSFTVCGWAMVRSASGSAYKFFCSVENNTSNALGGMCLGYNNSNHLCIISLLDPAYTEVVFASDPTLNSWFFFYLLCSGTGAGSEIGGFCHSGSSFVTASTAGRTFTTANLMLGNDSYDEFFDGIIGDVKVFDSALAQIDLYTEMYNSFPKTTTPHLWSPLFSTADLTDYSGNGKSWTSAGTLTDEVSPPISWENPRFGFGLASAATPVSLLPIRRGRLWRYKF